MKKQRGNKFLDDEDILWNNEAEPVPAGKNGEGDTLLSARLFFVREIEEKKKRKRIIC